MFSKMAMQHTRQAPGGDIHRHFSLAPARSHTYNNSEQQQGKRYSSNPQPAPAPRPLQGRVQARKATSRAPHLPLIPLSPPHPPPPALSHAPPHLKPRVCTDGEGRRNNDGKWHASVTIIVTANTRPGRRRSTKADPAARAHQPPSGSKSLFPTRIFKHVEDHPRPRARRLGLGLRSGVGRALVGRNHAGTMS